LILIKHKGLACTSQTRIRPEAGYHESLPMHIRL